MASVAREAVVVTGFRVRDVRFPTSDHLDGSDAMNKDPDYSAVYVELHTNQSGTPQKTALQGNGMTFTLGRGSEVVACAANSLLALPNLVVGRSLESVASNMGSYWREVVGDSQMRWIGPEKGAIHLATAAIINAWWDLWSKYEGKPLWKLLVDMSPEELVRVVDWRYMTDALTQEEAIAMLRELHDSKGVREEEMGRDGYPTYITSAGWLGYSDEKIRELSEGAIRDGWTHLKIKVGRDKTDDVRRCALIRDVIGYDRHLMIDANQVWDVPQAIEWMQDLVPFKPLWIEEPTSPDDILGHATIAKEMRKHGVGVATGEHCQNRVVFKQLLQAEAISFLQLDSCRLGGVNECVAVMLLAAKFKVPVCPHAGGVGLCEYIQHLSIFDYIAVSGSLENRIAEFADHLHEHFVDQINVVRGKYMPPTAPGYSITMKEESLRQYDFENGSLWRERRQNSSNCSNGSSSGGGGRIYKLVYYVPVGDADAVKDAVFASGAGRIGDYEACCWQAEGKGQFRPLRGANPTIGEVGALEHVTETKVEMVCDGALIKAAVQALVAAHPYEEPAYQVWPVLDIDSL
eukprot:TRINITY_DN15142_c0_g1_i1.p1 TRINITY_DN15142_c0_g1~~TRINITY_DN15142_c0_g1_i1.p1  ORF type:complete len:575 (+),score=86.43 TRINITY_DN15142_c0_g1_i1:135-1859(+)